MKFPDKINLANLPTPIEKLDNSLSLLSIRPRALYLKRDDMTGSEASGNKIRKLEYALALARKQGAGVLITCGAVQSNHCRATAVAAAKLGLKAHLVFSTDGLLQADSPADKCPDYLDIPFDGNLLVDKLVGATFTFISPEDYDKRRDDIMEDIKKSYEKDGIKGYVLPEGASDGIGVFGYANAFYEILEQEKKLGVKFDTVCLATGSAGTIAGLYLGNEVTASGKNIVAINVSRKPDNFKERIMTLIDEAHPYSDFGSISDKNLHVIYNYYGAGYAKTRPEEIAFYKQFSAKEGILVDPVYSGKALYGLFQEIDKGNPIFTGNVLFVHTGGHYGLFAKKEKFLE